MVCRGWHLQKKMKLGNWSYVVSCSCCWKQRKKDPFGCESARGGETRHLDPFSLSLYSSLIFREIKYLFPVLSLTFPNFSFLSSSFFPSISLQQRLLPTPSPFSIFNFQFLGFNFHILGFLPDRMEPRIGNKFRLGRKIGSGSFGEIYLGFFPTFNFSFLICFY